jgi:hypothetical protein
MLSRYYVTTINLRLTKLRVYYVRKRIKAKLSPLNTTPLRHPRILNLGTRPREEVDSFTPLFLHPHG